MTTAPQVNLKALDIMTTDPVSISPGAGIRELARLLEEHEISGVPVVDESGKVRGVVTKTDLIRRCSEGTDDVPPSYLFELLSERGGGAPSTVLPEPLVCVQDFMTEDVLTVNPDTAVVTIARLMHDRRVHRVIVVDDEGFPIGIITSLDVLSVFPTR